MPMSAARGVIRRRILVNYRVDPEVMACLLPPPFQPKRHRGSAIAGICLIRLERMRPGSLGVSVGVASENAAHRIAVTWAEADGTEREGVYIPRRDTSSLISHLAGGRLLPGEHQRARFCVRDEGGIIDFAMRSAAGAAEVRLRGRETDEWDPLSGFASLEEASTFFEAGSIGYSPRRRGETLDGIRLETQGWRVSPLRVESVFSSFFADPARFPAGSVAFDCALLMRDIPHRWLPLPERQQSAPPPVAPV